MESSQHTGSKMKDSNKSLDELFSSTEEIKELIPEPKIEDVISITIHKLYSPKLQRNLDRLRFLFNVNEYSSRGMLLTEAIIVELKNHYAAWDYRKEFLKKYGSPSEFRKELVFCNETLLQEPKGFQTWEHKRFCIEQLSEFDYENETKFLSQIFDLDAKNYHAWSFKVFATKRFELYDIELQMIQKMLPQHIDNNSVWSYRKFLSKHLKIPPQVEEEFLYPILSSNLNVESIWYYLDDVYESQNSYSQRFKDFCLQKVSEHHTNRFILGFLLINEIRRGLAQADRKAMNDWLQQLRDKYDTMRVAYWDFFEKNYITGLPYE